MPTLAPSSTPLAPGFWRQLLLVAAALVVSVPLLAAEPVRNFEKWEKTIVQFEERDKQQPPAPGQVVFIGSSSIRLWKLEQSFPGKGYINRGFGGSIIADSTHFADRILLPLKPRAIVLYAGDNDLASGLTPAQILADFQAFVKKVRAGLPETPILYISLKPSPSRRRLLDKAKDTNALIAAECKKHDKVTFVDIFTPMLNDQGEPREELFVSDKLHMNPDGYKLWTTHLQPHLARLEKPTP